MVNNNSQNEITNFTLQNDVLENIKTELSGEEDSFNTQSGDETNEKKKKLIGKKVSTEMSCSKAASTASKTPIIENDADPNIIIPEFPIKTENSVTPPESQTSSENTSVITEDNLPRNFDSDTNLSEKINDNVNVRKNRVACSKKKKVKSLEFGLDGRRKSIRLTKTQNQLNCDDTHEPPTTIKKNKLRTKKKIIDKTKIFQTENISTDNPIDERYLSESEIPDPPEIIMCEPDKFECIICGCESETNESHVEHLLKHSPSECECLYAYCHQVFSDGLLLEEHFTTAHGDGRKFACIICNKAFRAELNRDRHVFECSANKLGTTDQSDSNLVCDYCEVRFLDEIEFKIHLGAHIHEGIYNCQLCKRKFRDELSLDEHLLLHREFQCKLCDKSYITKRSLGDHIRLKHTDKHLICSLCKRTFKDEQSLKEHSRQHEIPKNFVCSQCDKAYTTEHCLKDHMRRKHKPDSNTNDANINLCPVCKKRIRTGGMIRHMMFHNKIKPFLCTFCEKRFQDRAKLNEHLRIHYGVKPCICTECGKGFRTKAELRTHFITHIKPGDPKYKDVYQTCPVCNQYAASIQKHMRQYHVKETVICETCGKTFSSKASYSEHIAIHNTEKPKHLCEICKRTFSRRWNMLSHRERHSNEKYSARFVKKLEGD